MPTPIKVTKVVTEHDMRGIHKPRATVRCRAGEAWLFVNRARTIARLVDTTHSIHSYYAPKGEVFDLPKLQLMVAAMRLRLQAPAGAFDEAGAQPAKGKGKLAGVR